MENHTAGRWEAIGVIVKGEHSQIASCGEDTKPRVPLNQAVANARLIAAAPEMLETLTRLANTADMISGALLKKHPKFSEGMSEIAKEARDSIAKAEGKR